MDHNTIKFTKDGIKTKQTISSPLTKPEEKEVTIPYSGITNHNPLNLHVAEIIPKFTNGMLTEIELKILKEEDNQPSSEYHDGVWYKGKVLEILSDRKEWKKDSIYDKLKAEFNHADRKILKSGRTRGYVMLSTYLRILKEENKTENPRKGLWKLR
jgi:hypothetical protein